MKRKSLYFFVFFFHIFFYNEMIFSQSTNYNGFPPAAVEQPAQQETPGTQVERPTGQTASPTQQQPGFSMNKYDPYLDNHLRSPDPAEKMGLFGQPIKAVEEMLRRYGAKNYSYAFGKYSRMTMSAYIITMYFDRQRRLGGISVEPRPPYKYLAPNARQFFVDLFGEGADMSKFESIVSASRFEMRYKGR
jgi:hypothetical protein